MNLRTVLLTGLFLSPPALADGGSADGGSADGGDDTPDASVGNGGADQNTEESDEDMSGGTCHLSRDCQRGFGCVDGRCRYVGFRQATQGCSAARGPWLAGAAGWLMALGTRRRRPPR